MTAKASSDDSIEDEIDALLESSLKTKDLNNSTWNFEDYKKYTIKKSAPVPEIMSLMTKAIEKEQDLLSSRIKQDLRLKIIDKRTFDRKNRDIERWVDAEQREMETLRVKLNS